MIALSSFWKATLFSPGSAVGALERVSAAHNFFPGTWQSDSAVIENEVLWVGGYGGE